MRRLAPSTKCDKIIFNYFTGSQWPNGKEPAMEKHDTGVTETTSTENDGRETASDKITQTIGIDLGDKEHHFHILDGEGETIQSGTFPGTWKALKNMFAQREKTTVAFEAGTHSPWISRDLEAWGHRVLVGNPRKLRAIYQDPGKCDERDAEMLARLARFEPSLLCPIQHRGEKCQADLAVLKGRDALVRARASLINHCRGAVKSFGARLPTCSAPSFERQAREELPEPLRPALDPVLDTIGELTNKIKEVDKTINVLGEEYAETAVLREINGVGALTSLAFVLTLESPARFEKSRSVPAHLGLLPRRDQSGDLDKQLPITKAGNKFLRRLLVSCAHYVLGPFGKDCDLRRWGLKLCACGGKNAKKRATVAVARKLSVIMHRLWSDSGPYDAFLQAKARGEFDAQAQVELEKEAEKKKTEKAKKGKKVTKKKTTKIKEGPKSIKNAA